MKLIVCLDDNLGMMFNHRRQSRDRVLIADLLGHIGCDRLWISPYSTPLFPADDKNIAVAEDPCGSAGMGDYCFVEDTDPLSRWEDVSEIIIYRWHRLYPADVRFTGDMTGFYLAETTDFVGSSHDTITKEVWKK